MLQSPRRFDGKPGRTSDEMAIETVEQAQSPAEVWAA